MGRLFAAALNCEGLPLFQKNPRNQEMPCLSCRSCQQMARGNHSDFIEIDGASHTGVDNIRVIIEAATLLPVLGTRRIYLIDEAHMLSKAAFNAFLKILEEPPAHVHFILATTEVNKIIETVRSRAFQVFFNAVPAANLLDHLSKVCVAEKITYTTDGLAAIVHNTDGSVRDALNLLEQVRFSSQEVTHLYVQRMLGQPPDEIINEILVLIGRHDQTGLLTVLTTDSLIKNCQPYALWQALVLKLRDYLVRKDAPQALPFSRTHALYLAEQLYAQELLLSKTTQPRALLEMLLCKLCESTATQPISPVTLSNPTSSQPSPMPPSSSTSAKPASAREEAKEASPNVHPPVWQKFLTRLAEIHDPLVYSMMQQSYPTIEEEQQRITISFPKELSFFNDLLESTQGSWKPLLSEIFGTSVQINAVFCEKITSRAPKPGTVTKSPQPSAPSEEKKESRPTAYASNGEYRSKKFFSKKPSAPFIPKEPVLDASDVAQWPHTNSLLSLLPGTVTIIQEEPT